MDFRNSKLIVALAIAFGLVISTVAYLGFRNAGRSMFDLSEMNGSPDGPHQPYDRRYVQASHRDATRDEIRSLKKLRELVRAKEHLLQSRTEELRQAARQRDLLRQDLLKLQRQHSQLRRETDQTLSAFVELSSQIDTDDNQLAPAASESSRAAGARSDDDTELEVEIDLIQWQIEQANQRIADLELAALRELVRSSEATQTLVATGAAAVPALLDRLADEDPDVRQWAANVLGQIGTDASLAVDALLEALNDENKGVRDAARMALDRIENRS